MNTFKKILSCLVLACLIACLLPAGAAFAAGDTQTEHTHVWGADGICTGCKVACTHPDDPGWTQNTNGTMTCGTCHFVCRHGTWDEVNHKCAICGKECETHDFDPETGYCRLCGKEQAHHWAADPATGICTVCYLHCAHNGEWDVNAETGARSCHSCEYVCPHDGNWTEDSATGTRSCDTCHLVCGTDLTHDYTLQTGACDRCGFVHVDHQYTDDNDCVCDVCGYERHTYDNGVCTRCQAAEPAGEPVASLALTNQEAGIAVASISSTAVASIGDTGYDTLQEAFGAALTTETTVTLLKDISLIAAAEVTGGKNIKLEMGSFSISGSIDGLIKVTEGTLTVNGNTLTSTGGDCIKLIPESGKTATVTIGGGATLSASSNCVDIGGAGASTLNTSGTLRVSSGSGAGAAITQSSGTVNVTGGTVTGATNALELTTGGTAVISGGTVSGSTNGIFQNGGTVTVKSNATVSGASSGVYVQAGTLNVESGSVSSTGSAFDGSTGAGAAIYVKQAASPAAITVAVSGGSITGLRSLYETGSDSTVAITISGGTFTGDVVSESHRVTVSGSPTIPATTPDKTISGSEVSATVPAGAIKKNWNNIVDVTNGNSAASKATVTVPKAEYAAVGTGSLQVKADVADVKFDADAAAAVAAASGTDMTLTVTNTQTTSTTKTFTLTLSPSITSFGTGTVTVVLHNVDIAPTQVVHEYSDGSGGSETFTAPGGSGDKHFAYDSAARTVTVSIRKFSTLTVTGTVPPTGTAPVITTPATLLAAVFNAPYSLDLEATGSTPITWALASGSNSLPNSLTLSSAGRLSGTPTDPSGSYTFTIEATNSVGTASRTFSLSISDAVAQVIGSNVTYSTVQAAIDAAPSGGKVALLADTNEDVTINKNLTFEGSGHKIGAVVVSNRSTVTLSNIVSSDPYSDYVIAREGSTVTLTGSQTSVGAVDSNRSSTSGVSDAMVKIDSGYYGTLPGSGRYFVTGGTFSGQVPLEYCGRTTNSDGSVNQYYSYYDSADRRWHLTQPYRPKVTKVNNSAYYVMRSDKSLSFTTDIPYDPFVSSNGDITELRYESGNSESRIASNKDYYTIGKDANGYTVVTLTNKFLRLLGERRYVLNIVTKMGTADAYFHVSTVGKTGDTSNIGLWAGIMGGSVVVLGGVAFYLIRKSKKKNK